MSTTTNTELKIYVQHGMESLVELQVDSNHAIGHVLLNNKKQKEEEEEKEELSIMYQNKLLIDQKESFKFYNIENESTLYVIKNKLNISLIDSNKVIVSDMIQASPHNTIKQVLQQNPLLTRVIGNQHHFMYNGILINKDNKEYKTLYQLGIHDDVFIHIEDTMVIIHQQQQQQQQQQPQPPLKKKKKNRCALVHCSDKVCKVIGECTYCQSSYCSRHRLPEAHTCINLTNCKRVAHERNSVKLLGERCVASKI